jgi:hypothetical protein
VRRAFPPFPVRVHVAVREVTAFRNVLDEQTEGITPYQLLNASTNLYETRYVYHDTRAHLNGVLHKSLPSVCMSVCVSLLPLVRTGSVKCIPPFIARQRLGKYVPAATNAHNNRRIVVRVSVGLCIPLSLLCNNSVKISPRQRGIVGGVFRAVRVVSKEGRLKRSSSQNLLLAYFPYFEKK